jgi:ABC-type polysaccharide/polyol phosphate transport system ATPase subunit
MGLKPTNTPPSKLPRWNGQDPAVEVCNVTKSFYIYEHRVWSLRELFIRLVGRRLVNERKSRFSLRDISLTIGQGETLALIGSNGVGKSTLLRLIAGIYWPTSGVVITRGHLAALIELTAGFHLELTGSENIHLYGSILGLNKNELSRRYPEIVDFAGIPDFMSTPVKYYSSGMLMRLAFSVATLVQPEILLLDEVFAVGDTEFRERCLDRLQLFQNSGCTIILATHDLEMAQTFATQAVWLEKGHVHQQGAPYDIIEAYRASF